MNVAATCAPVKHLALVVILSLCTALPTWAQVKLTQGPEQIAVEINGKPFTVFYIGGKDLNRPYTFPCVPPPARSSTVRFLPASCRERPRIIRTMPACSTATAM